MLCVCSWADRIKIMFCQPGLYCMLSKPVVDSCLFLLKSYIIYIILSYFKKREDRMKVNMRWGKIAGKLTCCAGRLHENLHAVREDCMKIYMQCGKTA